MNSKQIAYLFSIPYFITAILVISSKLMDLPEIENILKPLLLTNLMIWFVIDRRLNKLKINQLFIFALFFSLLGDIFLMPLFDIFILGLVFFLLSHLFYIVVFMKGNGKLVIPSFQQGKIFLFGILAVYFGLLYVLMPDVIKLESLILLIAVPIYATVLLIMVLSTFVYSKAHFYNFGRYILLGGLLFLISDGILALNKFSFDVPYTPIWVMGTYVLAQWMLVFGYLNSQKTS